jgi:PIN domain nuclease of toxin-antitoxin system
MHSLRGVIDLRALLDTQVLVQAYSGGINALSRKARTLLTADDTERCCQRNLAHGNCHQERSRKVQMGESEVREAVRDLRLTILPFTAQHGYRLFGLPLHHRDPLDRMLIATALAEEIPIIGSDRLFKMYKGLEVIC